MKKYTFALVLCGLLSACSTFEKTAYEQMQKQQIEKDNKFKPAGNPAEEFSKTDYLSYEQYKKEKELVRKSKKKED